jgi:glycosyltransferase involved in cell wall biosynthesis
MLSGIVHDSILVLAWLLAFVWWRRSIEALRGIRTMLDLTELDRDTLPQLIDHQPPHLTVVVPARDEATSIEATLRSLFSQTGIRLQIVAVDDRSVDATGAKMDALATDAASGPHAYEVLHIRELPSGWLGKPHALAKGVERAKAPWLLFTDADVLFVPEALHLALRTAIREKVDHFVLAPTLISERLAEAAIQATIQVLGHFIARLWKIGDPNARDAFGVGGFSMVRREALSTIGGIDRLRMEVVEDVSLGWLIKREWHGRSLMVLGPGLVRLRWLNGTFGIVRLLEKNAFAGMRYNVPMTLVVCLSLLLHALVPLAALAEGPWGMVAAALTYSGIAIGIHANRKLNRISPLLALMFAPSVLIVVWAFLRSMALTLVRGGVVWRGTLYPLNELKKGMVHFWLA